MTFKHPLTGRPVASVRIHEINNPYGHLLGEPLTAHNCRGACSQGRLYEVDCDAPHCLQALDPQLELIARHGFFPITSGAYATSRSLNAQAVGAAVSNAMYYCLKVES